MYESSVTRILFLLIILLDFNHVIVKGGSREIVLTSKCHPKSREEKEHADVLKSLTSLYFPLEGARVGVFDECYLPEPSSSQICSTDTQCIELYTPKFSIAQSYNASFVSAPVCQDFDEGGSPELYNDSSGRVGKVGVNGASGYCTCEGSCRSYSRTRDNEIFYYCGPCGRLGSECAILYNSSCTAPSSCRGSFCECPKNGVYYELFYCIIPDYGYEVALQMAIGTCILVAICLLLATISTAIGIRIRRINTLRQLLRRQSGTTRSPPNDNPPKYDDVVIDGLPSYQDALQIDQETTPAESGIGIENSAFENDVEDTTVTQTELEDIFETHSISDGITKTSLFADIQFTSSHLEYVGSPYSVESTEKESLEYPEEASSSSQISTERESCSAAELEDSHETVSKDFNISTGNEEGLNLPKINYTSPNC